MTSYLDNARECFQDAKDHPWHNPARGRQYGYYNLSLALHYANLSLNSETTFTSRYETDEDAICRSMEGWWFRDISETDQKALAEAGIGISDFMKVKYGCDIRGCFSEDEYLEEAPATTIGGHFFTLQEGFQTFKESLRGVIEKNISIELLEKSYRERWYSNDTMTLENAINYYRRFCEDLLGISAINKMGGTVFCDVPQAKALKKLAGVKVPHHTLADNLFEISPQDWADAIDIPLEQWAAAGINPLQTQAVLTREQWVDIARTPCRSGIEKYAVKGGGLFIFEM